MQEEIGDNSKSFPIKSCPENDSCSEERNPDQK